MFAQRTLKCRTRGAGYVTGAAPRPRRGHEAGKHDGIGLNSCDGLRKTAHYGGADIVILSLSKDDREGMATKCLDKCTTGKIEKTIPFAKLANLQV